jgi:GT2 family glycosyltransferase
MSSETPQEVSVSRGPIARDLTVVIPTLGRECLRGCLKAIADGSMVPAEIVLSHQGPAGAMDSMLRDFEQLGLNIRYIHSTQRGAAAGRNLGLQQVRTRNFASTDDDCYVDRRWLEEIDASLKEYPRQIVTGRVLASDAGAPSVNSSTETRTFMRAPLKGDHFAGGNFGAAVSLLAEVGLFDESELLRYCEDPEWAYRALQKGFPIRFVPAVTVTHLHWRDGTEITALYTHYAHSQGGWFGRELRHGEVSFLVRLGYEIARGSKRWCLGSITGDLSRKVNGRAFVVDMLRGVAHGWQRH